MARYLCDKLFQVFLNRNTVEENVLRTIAFEKSVKGKCCSKAMFNLSPSIQKHVADNVKAKKKTI